MAAEEVKLFGYWASPYSSRVETALKLKGVQYEFVEEDLGNKSPLLLEYNPVHKKVPVLLHNGKPICESGVILEYIDETWKGSPILPPDPYGRAMARFWAKFIDEKCMPAARKAWASKGEEKEKATEEAHELLETLEGQLEGNKFFGGDSIGLVDIISNFFFFGVGVFYEATGGELFTEEKYPHLCRLGKDYGSYSALKESLPPRDKFLAHIKARYALSN